QLWIAGDDDAGAGFVGGAAIAAFPLGEQLQAAADVVVFVARAVALDGDVEGDVPALIEPGGYEVRLQLGDRLDDELELVPLVALLHLHRVVPQDGDG